MIQLNNVDHLNMNVKNLKETVAFYHDLFGLEVKEEGIGPSSGKPYQIIGKKDSLYLCLYEVSDLLESENQHLNHFGVHVKNFDEVENLLKEKGVAIHYGGVVPYQNSRSLYISDPNGIEIEISENFGGALD